MKRQATVFALGAALIAAMTAPSFATQARAHHAKTNAQLTSSYSGYYDFNRARGQLHDLCQPRERKRFQRDRQRWSLITSGR